jgi:hypothetical protein
MKYGYWIALCYIILITIVLVLPSAFSMLSNVLSGIGGLKSS